MYIGGPGLSAVWRRSIRPVVLCRGGVEEVYQARGSVQRWCGHGDSG